MVELRKILLVEDNADDVELTVRALRENHIANQIIVARNGEEAIDYMFRKGAYAKREETMPALVLLDLKLPKIDGFEVLRQLRSNPHTKLVPVVVLTSSKEEKDMTDSYSLGANSYVRKPIDFDQFTEAAKTLGLYWLVLNEPPAEIE
jgi:two-component system response regulator